MHACICICMSLEIEAEFELEIEIAIEKQARTYFYSPRVQSLNGWKLNKAFATLLKHINVLFYLYKWV